MNRAQLFLIAILCVASLRKYVGADKVEQGHRDSHHEKDYSHHRAKRYTRGRVPVAYLYNRLNNEDGYTVDKRYRPEAISTNPVASHFRELQVRQAKRPYPPAEDEYLSPPQMESYRNLLQYSGRNGNNLGTARGTDFDIQNIGEDQALPQTAGGIGPLSDDELQSLLLLLEEYRLQGKSPPLRNFYNPPPQYFTPEMEFAGTEKRETGKRAINRGPLVLEQPMSFENSLGGDSYPVFLNQKRSKRVGNPALKMKSVSNTRIKKETDPAVEAELDKVFGGSASSTEQQTEAHTSRHSTAIPTTPIASSNQIPPPSSSQKKPKKAIDWSDYFGIDKRQESQKHEHVLLNPSSNLDAINHSEPNKTPQDEQHGDDEQAIQKPNSSGEGSDKTATSSSASTTTTSTTVAINVGGKRDSQASEEKAKNEKGKKEDAKKLENNADEKPDRQWILKEFYKNLAMSTNVKRKRESPPPDASNDIDKLEKIERKMQEAGDQIIWDALKYTGAHKDAELSPEELAQVKNQIIQKLAAAYSLEKVREAIEEFRQQLEQLKDKQQYY